MKIKLTSEESQHLINLGVSKELATGDVTVASMTDGMKGIIQISMKSIFKLEDFLNGKILPKELMLDKEHGLDFGWDFYENKWFARYSDEDSICVHEKAWYSDKELINAFYQLTCWYYGEYFKSEKK